MSKLQFTFETACEDGDFLTVKKLAGNDRHKLNINIGLIRAAARGRISIIRYLVDLDAGVNYIKAKSLRWAAEFGHLRVVNYLIKVGAVPAEEMVITARDRNHLNVAATLATALDQQ